MSRFKVGTVIRGTMRLEDLIPALLELLPEERQQEILKGHGMEALPPEDDVWWRVSQEAVWLFEEVWDAVEELAPPGTYFGAHPGDGSDIGFWPLEGEGLEEEWA